MHTEVETALRATRRWIMARFYGSAMPDSLEFAYYAADEVFTAAGEATKRERTKLIRQGFGIEALKSLQLAIEDAGLWNTYAKGARTFTGRAYDLDEGLAIARAL